MTNQVISTSDLPMTFQAKYLGSCKAAGLWGIKHTRKPVDLLVETAKTTRASLPLVEIQVSTTGLHIQDIITPNSKTSMNFPIDCISYGVQDLTFTRVFCMIVCNSQALEESTKVSQDSHESQDTQLSLHPLQNISLPRTSNTNTKNIQENLFTCHAFACESKHQARQLTFALAAAFKHFADMMKTKQDKEKLARTIDLRTAEQIADEESETEA